MKKKLLFYLFIIIVLNSFIEGCNTLPKSKPADNKVKEQDTNSGEAELSAGEPTDEANDLEGSMQEAQSGQDNDYKEVEKPADLPEGFLYIGISYPNQNSMEQGVITIYNRFWEPMNEFRNAYVLGEIGMVKEDIMIPIGYETMEEDGMYSIQYGLYSLEKSEFILPTVYSNIMILDKEKGYYAVSDLESYSIVDLQGNVITSGVMQSEGFGISKRGEYYWIYDYSSDLEQEVYKVYDSEFRLVKEVDWNYGECEIYHEDGTLYFSKSLFFEKYGYPDGTDNMFYLQSFESGEPLIYISYNGTLMVLDREFNILSQKPEDSQYNSYYSLYYDIYSDTEYNNETGIETGIFYDRTGNVIKDQGGNAYTNIVDENYWGSGEKHEQILYYVNESKLNILMCHDDFRVTINLKDWYKADLKYVFNDIYIVWNNDHPQKTRIYKDDQLLQELDGWYYLDNVSGSYLSKSILLASHGMEMGENKYLVMNDQGELLYQSMQKEFVISVDDKYIQLIRDNQWGIIDYDSKIVIDASLKRP